VSGLYGHEEQVADLPAYALAWRFWRVRAGRLDGVSALAIQRQTWGPGLNTVTTPCSMNPTHEAPAGNCQCGCYATETRASAVAYMARTTIGREPSTPVAVGAVRTVGPRRLAYPWPIGDPRETFRVGAAEIVGPLYLFPGTEVMRAHLERVYGVPVIASETPNFREWVEKLAADA
jgi:hypothetical protein